MLLYGQLVLVLCVTVTPGDARRCRACRDITEILPDPCGGRNPVRRVGRGRRETCPNHALDISTEAGRVEKLAQRLVEKYTSKGDRSSGKIRISDRLKNHLLSTRYFNLSGSLLNYDDIASITVFVHAACTQEPNLHFEKAICKLDDALIHLLCKVKIAHYRGCFCPARDPTDVPGRVNLCVYPFTTKNNAARHQRDFMVFRDIASNFQNASEMNC